MPVHVSGTLDVPPDRRSLVIAALPVHIRLTRSEPGCLLFEIEECPTGLRVREIFADNDAFVAHQSRLVGTDWANVTQGLKRDYEIQRG